MEQTLRRLGQIHNTSSTLTVEVLLRVLTTAQEMFRDRGCRALQCCATVEQVEECMRQGECVLTGERDDGSVARLFLCQEDKLGVKQLRLWLDASEPGDKLVIVSLDGPTAFTRRSAEVHDNDVQFFTFAELSVNVTKHRLVPRHRRVASCPYEAHEVPKLDVNDRVCQYYDFKVGDTVEITRTCGAQQPHVYYRRVCDVAGV